MAIEWQEIKIPQQLIDDMARYHREQAKWIERFWQSFALPPHLIDGREPEPNVVVDQR